MSYPGADLYLVLKGELILKIIIRMSQNERESLHFDIEIRNKDPDKGIPGVFKPMGQYGVVDMPQAVGIAERWCYSSGKHTITIHSIERVCNADPGKPALDDTVLLHPEHIRW